MQVVELRFAPKLSDPTWLHFPDRLTFDDYMSTQPKADWHWLPPTIEIVTLVCRAMWSEMSWALYAESSSFECRIPDEFSHRAWVIKRMPCTLRAPPIRCADVLHNPLPNAMNRCDGVRPPRLPVTGHKSWPGLMCKLRMGQLKSAWSQKVFGYSCLFLCYIHIDQRW